MLAKRSCLSYVVAIAALLVLMGALVWGWRARVAGTPEGRVHSLVRGMSSYDGYGDEWMREFVTEESLEFLDWWASGVKSLVVTSSDWRVGDAVVEGDRAVVTVNTAGMAPGAVTALPTGVFEGVALRHVLKRQRGVWRVDIRESFETTELDAVTRLTVFPGLPPWQREHGSTEAPEEETN